MLILHHPEQALEYRMITEATKMEMSGLCSRLNQPAALPRVFVVALQLSDSRSQACRLGEYYGYWRW